jgi:hypothetical protein
MSLYYFCRVDVGLSGIPEAPCCAHDAINANVAFGSACERLTMRISGSLVTSLHRREPPVGADTVGIGI